MSYSQAMEIKKTKELIKLVENMGFLYSRTCGSHEIYIKVGSPSLSIPVCREIARGTLRQVLKIAYGVNHA